MPTLRGIRGGGAGVVNTHIISSSLRKQSDEPCKYISEFFRDEYSFATCVRFARMEGGVFPHILLIPLLQFKIYRIRTAPQGGEGGGGCDMLMEKNMVYGILCRS